MTASLLPAGIVASCTEPDCPRSIYSGGLEVCHEHIGQQLGITYRQLDYWVRRGFLHPVNSRTRHGAHREWTETELEVARRMGRLTAAGLPLEWAAGFARNGWPRGVIAPGIVIEVAP